MPWKSVFENMRTVFSSLVILQEAEVLEDQLQWWDLKQSLKLRNERRYSILMSSHYADLGSASDWSCRSWNLLQPIRSTTLGSTRHQYGISALVSQTSFRGETNTGVAKCRLFSQVGYYTVTQEKEIWQQELYRLISNVTTLSCRLVYSIFLSIADAKFHV